jgi:rhodanese-related sulfurtransferase
MDHLISFISVADLRPMLATANAPLIFDVRRDKAYSESDSVLASARRLRPEDIESRMQEIPKNRSVIVYCVHGHEVSQTAVKVLRGAGVDARFLEGGFVAWQAVGAPLATKQPEVGVPSTIESGSRWITRERPKIDRIACPWLVRRFLDPGARFLYVASDQVLAEAQRLGAIPYDIPAVRFSHRGDQCSFDAFISEFGLSDPALAAVADVVRAADTGHLEDSPQAAGLLAVSLGLSAIYSDDHQMLEAGMLVYDALYAWARSARSEIHNAALFKDHAQSPSRPSLV